METTPPPAGTLMLYHVYSEVEPFEGWKQLPTGCGHCRNRHVYSEVEPFEGWKHAIGTGNAITSDLSIARSNPLRDGNCMIKVAIARIVARRL